MTASGLGTDAQSTSESSPGADITFEIDAMDETPPQVKTGPQPLGWHRNVQKLWLVIALVSVVAIGSAVSLGIVLSGKTNWVSSDDSSSASTVPSKTFSAGLYINSKTQILNPMQSLSTSRLQRFDVSNTSTDRPQGLVASGRTHIHDESDTEVAQIHTEIWDNLPYGEYTGPRSSRVGSKSLQFRFKLVGGGEALLTPFSYSLAMFRNNSQSSRKKTLAPNFFSFRHRGVGSESFDHAFLSTVSGKAEFLPVGGTSLESAERGWRETVEPVLIAYFKAQLASTPQESVNRRRLLFGWMSRLGSWAGGRVGSWASGKVGDYLGDAGGDVGADVGEDAGAAVGTALGGPLGGAIGGEVGAWGGRKLGQYAGDKLGSRITSNWQSEGSHLGHEFGMDITDWF